ncbi:MAG: threonine synthase, partial [Burkholderiales bacterium]|nr:threonine synthase [Burkholderiales bacterium]
MILCSTNNKDSRYCLEQAVFTGLPPDNGLFMPLSIPQLSDTVIQNLQQQSLAEIAYTISSALIGDEINSQDLRAIVDNSITFDAPLVNVHDNVFALELFHGPSLAFKDFGARFMAALMSYYLARKNMKVNILVATSGDTGSAVAQGFLNHPDISVTILYPSNKVSFIQEQQLTTLGNNITALEIDGTFDDCQRLVKTAFLDKQINSKLNLASANSINISRLIPQTFYYFYAYAQLKAKSIVVSVPCGNLGNLCAGVIAKKMGLPISQFIASTNINDVLPQFLSCGKFMPHSSLQTISNAMDVGNPSNFARLLHLYDNKLDLIRQDLHGKTFLDNQVKFILQYVYDKYNYILDPHGAIAYMGLIEYMANDTIANINTLSANLKFNSEVYGVFLETAHPAKFIQDVESSIGVKIKLPNSLDEIVKKHKTAIRIKNNYAEFKDYILT